MRQAMRQSSDTSRRAFEPSRTPARGSISLQAGEVLGAAL